MADGIARFRDFTGDTEPIQFKIHDQVFTCFEDIPLGQLGQLVDLGTKIDSDQDSSNAITNMINLFQKFLEPESFQRFNDAINGNGTIVIGINRIKKIVPWILEQYGLRPTVASSGSSTTLSETGADSTDGAASKELIPEPSAL